MVVGAGGAALVVPAASVIITCSCSGRERAPQVPLITPGCHGDADAEHSSLGVATSLLLHVSTAPSSDCGHVTNSEVKYQFNITFSESESSQSDQVG